MLLRRSSRTDDTTATNTSNPAAMSPGGGQYAANGQGPLGGGNGRAPDRGGNNWQGAQGAPYGQGGPNGQGAQGGAGDGSGGPGRNPSWSYGEQGTNGSSGPDSGPHWSQGAESQRGGGNGNGSQAGGNPNWQAQQGNSNMQTANGSGTPNGSGQYAAGTSNGVPYAPAAQGSSGLSNGGGAPNGPTLTSRPREAAAVENAPPANPDDYTPATEPETSLFKGHVKRATESGVPLYQDMVGVPGANLPQLRLDLHVYAAKPQERFALINMRKMHEGDTTADGVRVEAITPDGVIMSRNGSKFLLPRD
jgi:hypothetical protein